MTGKRVLVTGACGFIGRHVARLYAAAGWQVSGMGHGAWVKEELQRWGISEWHRADITLAELQACAGQPDVIVHCAGSSSVGFSISHPYEDFLRNVGTTAALLEFVRLYAPLARIVYPSSAAVYGNVKKLPITEDEATMPESPYGVHKLMAEHLCASYAKNFGISVMVLRLFSVYGNGLRKQLLWDACQKISSGKHAFFGTGSETRDWLNVNDAAELLKTAAEHADTTCPVINGGTGVSVTVQEILRELYASLNIGGQPVFNGVLRDGDPVHYLADISRAHALGWHAKVDWKTGIRGYAAWFKEKAA